MKNSIPKYAAPTRLQFFLSTVLVAAITIGINVLYFLLWGNSSNIPIPAPVDLEYIVYQTMFIIIANILVHFGYRHRMSETSFDYVLAVLVLFGINIALTYITVDIRRMPSINEIKRLYGAAGAPIELLQLSVPISIFTSLMGMFAIPYFAWRKTTSKQRTIAISKYRTIGIRLFKSYAIVALIILFVNTVYYSLYERLGGAMPETNYTISETIQMTIILTAVSAMLYLYLRDKSENGITMYVLLTIIFAFSAFTASLPRPEGQPIYDESLWLNIPIAIFSAVGELIGIPYFFKDLMKKEALKPPSEPKRQKIDESNYSR